MKVFAFLLAGLFILQATTPALCMTNCALHSFAASSDCAMEENESCCAGEIKARQETETNGYAEETQNPMPCNDCCIPCCSAPLCCFYFQEITQFDLSVNKIQLAGPLPSSNGVAHSGYHTECFQPPERTC